jgi:hypothetical protein
MEKTEQMEELGSGSIRRVLGIAAEDPRIFHPWELSLAHRAARIVARDLRVSAKDRPIVTLGVMVDLRPGDLTPSTEELARTLGVTAQTAERREADWEVFDPVLRFELVRRACQMCLLWRAQGIYK